LDVGGFAKQGRKKYSLYSRIISISSANIFHQKNIDFYRCLGCLYSYYRSESPAKAAYSYLLQLQVLGKNEMK
jgi:hypothetical protein